MKTILYTVILVALCCTCSVAQDIKLSTEPFSYIPLDAAGQIQSAEAIGDVTLAVWATTVLAPDGQIVNRLVYQMIQGTVPVDVPKYLTSTDSRPYEFVQVMAVRGQFFVFWKDRRGGYADSVYMLRVDTDGILSGSEEFFTSGKLQAPDNRKFKVSGNGFLLWDMKSGVITGTYARHVGIDGRFTAPQKNISSGSFIGQLMPYSPSGTTIGYLTLPLEMITVPRLLLNDGSIGFLPGNIGERLLYTNLYRIDPDGELVVLSNGTFSLYTNYNDVAPILQAQYTFPANALPYTAVVCRDSVGIYSIKYLVADNSFITKPTFVFNVGIIIHSLKFNRTTLKFSEDSGSAVKMALGTYTILSQPVASGDGGPVYKPSACTQFCNNNVRLSIQYAVSGSYRGEFSTRTTDFSFSYTGYCVFNRYGTIVNQSPVSCIPSSQERAQRIKSTYTSTIRVIAGNTNDTLQLSVPLLHGQYNVPQSSPVICARDRKVLCGWRSLGTDTLTVLSEWNDSVRAIEVKYDTGASQLLMTRGNAVVLHTIKNSRYSLYLPTAVGWWRIREMPAQTSNLIGQCMMNPNTGTMLCSLNGLDMELDGGGNSVAPDIRFGKGVSGLWQIPIRPGELLICDSYKNIYHYVDTAIVDTFPTLSITASTIMHRLYGDYFLYSALSDVGTLYNVRMCNLQAKVVKWEILDFGAPIKDVFILQNPADSSIILIYSRSGIRATCLDKHLNVITHDYLISTTRDTTVAHPAATIYNNILYTVWEDKRNGNTDIYGARTPVANLDLALSSERERPIPPDVAGSVVTVTPNPVNGIAYIGFKLSRSSQVRVTILTLQGTDVAMLGDERMDAGYHTVRWNTGNIPTGVYFCRVQVDGKSMVRNVVVVR